MGVTVNPRITIEQLEKMVAEAKKEKRPFMKSLTINEDELYLFSPMEADRISFAIGASFFMNEFIPMGHAVASMSDGSIRVFRLYD